MKPLASILALVAVTFCLFGCAPKPNYTGTWTGTVSFTNPLNNQKIDLPLTFHVTGEPGAYAATLDSPAQKATNQKVDTFTVTNDEVAWTLNSVQASYKGKGNADATKIDGTISQGGQSLPLILTKQATK